MANPLFVVSPLYIAVGFVIALLVIHEYLRFAGPRRQAVHRHSRHHHHHHHRHSTPAHGAD